MSEQAVSRVLFPEAVTHLGTMTIHLGPLLPTGSSNLPGNSDGQPSNASLFGLAPDGVCQAPVVTDRTGELLPHPFTLTPRCEKSHPEAVSFLLHFPSRRRDWGLPSILSCGARTFLPPVKNGTAVIWPTPTYE